MQAVAAVEEVVQVAHPAQVGLEVVVQVQQQPEQEYQELLTQVVEGAVEQEAVVRAGLE
jgi:hypothetical protein